MKTRKSIRAVFSVLLVIALLCGTLPIAFAAQLRDDPAVTLPNGGTYNVYDYCDETDYVVWYLDSAGNRSATETESTCAVSIRGVRSELAARTAGYLIVPDTYRGYPVVRLEKLPEDSLFLGVRIPAGVREISESAFVNCAYLERIEVDVQNPYYLSVDGALYRGNINFGVTQLVCYPQGKKDASFTTFAGAQAIREKAFFSNPYLRTLTIAVGAQGITVYPDAIRDCSALETLILGEGAGFRDLSDSAVRNCPHLCTVHLPYTFVGYMTDSGQSLGFFSYSSGARNVTVCCPFVSTQVAEDAAAYGYTCLDCNAAHYVPVADDPLLPAQPMPDPENISKEDLFLFTTLYQKDEDGKYVKDENGDYIAIGVRLAGMVRSFSMPVILEIPSSFRGLPVLEIDSIFEAHLDNLVGVHIPESVRTIENGALCTPTLQWITADECSPYFKSVDGVLYSADGKTLVAYPNGKAETRYTIPEGTEKLAHTGVFFDRNCPLQELTLPSTFVDPAFSDGGIGLTNLQKYVVSADNPAFYADEAGVLYSKDQTILLRYPASGPQTYTLPACVSAIDDFALANMNGQKVICVPDGAEYTPLANLNLADVIGHSEKIYLHIPQSVTSIRYADVGKTEIGICCETSASQAAAFAQKNELDFRICSADHTAMRAITAQDPPVPELITDDTFEFYYISKTDAYGTRIEGVGIYGPKQVPAEPYTLTIPETYCGFRVLEINEANYLYHADLRTNVTRVEIPSTVRSITKNSFTGCAALTEFVVDPSNPYYCAENGVLYNKGKTVLIRYPAAKRNTAYALPDTVESFADYSVFGGNPYLADLTIPASFAQDGTTAYSAMRTLSNLRSYTVAAGNPVYSSDMYGVLFNADKSVLLHFPPNAETEFYTIPASVLKLHNTASFRTTRHLRVLCVDEAASATPSGSLIPASESTLQYLHIPAGVTDIRFTLVRTVTICSETADCAAAAFAREKNRTFALCSSGHTQFTPVEPEDDLFDFAYISKTEENGETQNVGVTILGPAQTPTEPFALTIPAAYRDLPVLRVDVSGWPQELCGNLTALHLPETVEIVEGIASMTATYFTNLATITVDDRNPNLYASDNVLFHKSAQTLLLYPAGKRDASYTVPDGVTSFFSFISFSDNCSLRELTLPASFTGGVLSQTFGALRRIPSLERVTVAAGNPNFSSDQNGVLYNADGTVLILYPRCAPADVFTIPERVGSFYDDDSIDSPKNLRVLCVADGVTQTPVGRISLFTYADPALQYIHIPSSVTDIRFIGLRSALTICSDAADCAAASFAAQNGNAFVLCQNDHTTFLQPDDPPAVPASSLSLRVSDGTAKPGETVSVTVDLTQNPGIVAMRLHLQYDPAVLTLTNVLNGGLLGGAFVAGGDLMQAPYTVLWEDGLSHVNNTSTGTIVTFTFRVRDDAQAGAMPVTVTCDASSTYNVDLVNVPCEIRGGAVQIVTRVAGDANADGTLDLRDVVLLRRMLAGGWNVTVRTENMDVDGDGILSLKDATLLSRYIVGGWNVTLQ